MVRQGIRLAAACALAALSLHPVLAHPAQPAVQVPRLTIADHVREAAQRFGIPEDWIYAVIRAESAGRIRAVSSAGALGLMQLMPGTWARQRSRFGLGTDPFDPRDNILAGTSYLREMYDRYGESGFLAAYNAGPARYEQWRDQGRPLPAETRRYVEQITGLLRPARIFITSNLPTGSSARASFAASSEAESLDHRRREIDPATTDLEREAKPLHDLFVPVFTPRGR